MNRSHYFFNPPAGNPTALTLGTVKEARGDNSIVIGNNTQSIGSQSVVIGDSNLELQNPRDVNGTNLIPSVNVVVGASNLLTNQDSSSVAMHNVVVGNSNQIGSSLPLTGATNISTGFEATVIGNRVKITAGTSSGNGGAIVLRSNSTNNLSLSASSGFYALWSTNNPSFSSVTGTVYISSHSSAPASNTVSIGPNALASSTGAVAVGQGAIASGGNSVYIGLGNNGTSDVNSGTTPASSVTGSNTVSVGWNNYVTSGYSTALGSDVSLARSGALAFATSRISKRGDNQVGLATVLRVQTTDATVTELLCAGQASSRIVLPNSSVYAFDVETVGMSTGGVIECHIRYSGLITRGAAAANTAMGYTPSKTTFFANSTCDVTLAADTTNGSLKITVTGYAKTIQWVANVRTTEVTF